MQSAPLNGSSHIQMTRARKKAPLLTMAALAVRLKPTERPLPLRSPAPPRCRRVIACGHSSHTRGPRSIRATTSRTSARRGTAGCSSTTRKSSGLTRRAYVRSSPWRICMCLRGRGLEKLEETGRKTECILRTFDRIVECLRYRGEREVILAPRLASGFIEPAPPPSPSASLCAI
jgi:hypothetical protein